MLSLAHSRVQQLVHLSGDQGGEEGGEGPPWPGKGGVGTGRRGSRAWSPADASRGSSDKPRARRPHTRPSGRWRPVGEWPPDGFASSFNDGASRGSCPVSTPRRRPPGPPLTDEQKRQITEEWRRAPRGATKLYKALARRGIHIPKMQIYRFGKAQGWVVPNPRKQRRRRSVRYERAHAGSLVHGDFHRTSEANPLRLPFLAKDETTFSRAGQGHGEYENAQPPPGPPDAERLSTCHVPKFAGNRYVNCSQNGSTVGSQWVWPATSNLSFIDKPEA